MKPGVYFNPRILEIIEMEYFYRVLSTKYVSINRFRPFSNGNNNKGFRLGSVQMVFGKLEYLGEV